MYPYEIKHIEGKDGEELLKRFAAHKSGFVEVGPKKYCLPKSFEKNAENYYNFELRKDDLWIMTFPRSGTTWMQEILWLINNNLDFKTASEVTLHSRFPFFEFDLVSDEKFIQELVELNPENPNAAQEFVDRHYPGWRAGPTMSSPRHFKTHLPPSLVPPKLFDTCKVVYVARNPYDVAVSFYHHNKLLRHHDFRGEFEDYWDLFERNLVLYTPYWEQIKEGWALRNHPNCLFLFYEDLLRDLPANVRKISKFLNKPITEDGIKKLAEHVHIDNFRKNVPLMKEINVVGLVNPEEQDFIRRGKIGGNKEIQGELKKRIDKWFEENLSKTDIKFPKFK